MRFCTKEHKEVQITVLIESDGCAVINANDVNVLRFTEKGYVAFIVNSKEKVEKLKEMGFVINHSRVSLIPTD